MDKITLVNVILKVFILVASLYGVVRSPYLFIRSLIGRTRKIWSVVYNNEKWIYASETLACTIWECAILRNVLHVNSTFPFISWRSGAANVKWTSRVWRSCLNSVELNCVPACAEIHSKYHHPNSSIFAHWIGTYPICTYLLMLWSSPCNKVLGFWGRNQQSKDN